MKPQLLLCTVQGGGRCRTSKCFRLFSSPLAHLTLLEFRPQRTGERSVPRFTGCLQRNEVSPYFSGCIFNARQSPCGKKRVGEEEERVFVLLSVFFAFAERRMIDWHKRERERTRSETNASLFPRLLLLRKEEGKSGGKQLFFCGFAASLSLSLSDPFSRRQ